MRSELIDLAAKQNEVIKRQAEVIDSLFLLLLQHVSADELENIGEVEKIKDIAMIKEKIGGCEDDYC